MINGMVRGSDGRMMHKSYANYIATDEVIKKHGADAFRLWVAISAKTGSDVQFKWADVDYCWRFLLKHRILLEEDVKPNTGTVRI